MTTTTPASFRVSGLAQTFRVWLLRRQDGALHVMGVEDTPTFEAASIIRRADVVTWMEDFEHVRQASHWIGPRAVGGSLARAMLEARLDDHARRHMVAVARLENDDVLVALYDAGSDDVELFTLPWWTFLADADAHDVPADAG